MRNLFNIKNIIVPLLLAVAVPDILVFALLMQQDYSPYIIMLTMLMLVAASLYFVLYTSNRIRYQYLSIANLLEAIAEGDYTLRSKVTNDKDELTEVKQLLNTLTDRLATQSLEIKESQLLLDNVISHIDVAIVATDADFNLTFANPTACQLFTIENEKLDQLHIRDLGLKQPIQVGVKYAVELTHTEQAKTCHIYSVSYTHYGQQHYLLFISDIQRILMDKERDAWQKLHRVLSHEINNSLTPISSISNTLLNLIPASAENNQSTETPPAPSPLEKGLQVIKSRADSLHAFIDRFQRISRLPPPDKKPFCLTQLINKCIPLFTSSQVTLHNQQSVEVFADPVQLEQVLMNLLRNAEEAMIHAKDDLIDHPEKAPSRCIDIYVARQGNQVTIIIDDQGSGISNPDNLFVPYYSTKPGGSGIGLVLCRQIAFNHNGDLSIKNRDNTQGARAVLTITG